MKQDLLILSDLWGAQKATYLFRYISLLQSKYNIQFIDCCQIGQVDISNYTQENLHQQFVNDGIERSIEHLLKNYPQDVDILAFSIGGTIAWKANLVGLSVKNFCAVSATRLRYETQKPNSQLTLIYGALDNYQPNEQWYESLEIPNRIIFKQEGHELYQHPRRIQQICEILLM